MKKDYFLGLSEEGFHKIAYTEWGEAQSLAKTLICVHGLTRNSRDFDSIAHYLSERYFHVYCPDIVGRGESDWLSNPLHYTYEQYIADMNVMIAHTLAKEVDWIGTSMGGLIGMALASLPKSPIRRLILNDIGAQIPAKGLGRLSTYTGREPTFASLEEAKKYFKTIYADFGNLSEESWQHLTENSVKEVSPGVFATKVDRAVKLAPAKSKIAWQLLLHPLKSLEGSFLDINLWDVWGRIDCPVLIIHGKTSDILLPETIEKMCARHSATEVIEVSDAGHAPMLEDKDLLGKIYAWLIK